MFKNTIKGVFLIGPASISNNYSSLNTTKKNNMAIIISLKIWLNVMKARSHLN